MSIITIILFFVYTYGFGFSATFFFKNSDDFFERHIMRAGIGLGIIPVLLVLLNLFNLPIDWRILLLLSMVLPIFALVKFFKTGPSFPKIQLSKSNIYFSIVLLIFGLTLFMYTKGAFSYPYFEDDDPWAHATGIKYISIEKNFDDPNNHFMYILPYPPGYDGMMAILHQTSPSLMWTIKFFNALFISLGILFFYFFAKNFMKSSKKALIATAILAMVPCYLSHFIWAHSLVMTLLMVALYCLVMMENNKYWGYPLALIVAGISLTQPTKAVKFFVIFTIYIIVKSAYSGKFIKTEAMSVLGGYVISIIWWATNWKSMYMKEAVKTQSLNPTGAFMKAWDFIRRALPPNSGSASRPYTFNDFFIAKSQNMINNPVGIGIVICLIAILSVFFIIITYKSMDNRKKEWAIITLIWLVFTFFGVNSMTFKLPIGFFSFRFWMLMAVPLSILAAEGFWFILGFFKQVGIPKFAVSILLLILIFSTSGYQKYVINTSAWGPGQMWTSMDEVIGYVWLKGLPTDTKVFAYSGDEQVIGFDKFSCLWCDNVIGFRKDLIYRNASEVYSWLKKEDYQYLVVDGMAYRNFGAIYGENGTSNLLSKRIEEIFSFNKFQVVHQNKGLIIFVIK